MNLDPYTVSKTVQKIYDWHVSNRKSAHRPHLGGSQIGNECSRALWYQFHWCSSPAMDGRQIRLFQTGDLEEARFIAELRGIGCQVWDRDPETGKQISFTEHGGHFALSVDAIVDRLPESNNPHIVEMKTANEKNFRDCERKGVEESKPAYWAQMQIAMHLSGIGRAVLLMKNKNTDEIYMERVKYDAAEGMKLVAKAEGIIFAEKPPAKLNNDPSFYLCKFCDFRDVCHNGKVPEVNCRTCAHSTPERGGDGAWSCALGKDMTPCASHLFNPYAMPWEMTDAGPDWIEYTTQDGEVVRNHEGTSNKINAMWVPF